MPSFSSLAVASVLALGALARPQNGPAHRRWGGDNFCLTRSEAQQVATNYGNLIATYSDALANVALSPDFTDYSESVNTLIDECPQGSAAQAVSIPLLAASFTNRTAFEIGQGQQPNINFNQLNIWHSCDTVNIRWETTNTAPIPNPRPVVGMIAMEVSKAPQGNEYPYWIDTVYSEFDAGAWLSNLVDAGICKGNVTFPARH
jgi:hypothetical protein